MCCAVQESSIDTYITTLRIYYYIFAFDKKNVVFVFIKTLTSDFIILGVEWHFLHHFMEKYFCGINLINFVDRWG